MTPPKHSPAPSPLSLIAYLRRYLTAYSQAIDSIAGDATTERALIRRVDMVLESAAAACALAAARPYDITMMRRQMQAGFDVAMTADSLGEAAQRLGELRYNAIGHFAADESVPVGIIEQLLEDSTTAPFAMRLLGLSLSV